MKWDFKYLVPTVTPWRADGTLDEQALRREVAMQLDAGLRDLYIFGTAGEGYAVSDAQFLEVTRVFAEATRAGGAEPMVGVISLATTTMVERIEACRAMGVRRFQISMPSWAALQDDEVDAFFEEVLGSFRDLEFLHYNVARAKRQLTGPEYGRLSRRHPNLVATKQSTDSMGQIAASMEAAPDVRHYFVDGGYAYGSLLGDCGLLTSLSLANPDRMRTFVDAGTRRDVDALIGLQQELRRLTGGLIEVTKGSGRIDGAYDKIVWRMHDPEFPTALLPPYQGLPDGSSERYRAWIDEHLPVWSPGAGA